MKPEEINNAEQLAAGLAALHERTGLSFEKLATKAGLAAGTVNQWVNGKAFPRLDPLMQFVKACEEPVDPWKEAWQRAARARTPGGCQGTLTQPHDGEIVDSYPQISGRVTGLLPEHQLWIVVRRGVGGVFWPKEPQVSLGNDGSFTLGTIEGGAPGRLVISLLMVPTVRGVEFTEWLQRGHKANYYPPISPNDSDTELAFVSVHYAGS